MMKIWSFYNVCNTALLICFVAFITRVTLELGAQVQRCQVSMWLCQQAAWNIFPYTGEKIAFIAELAYFPANSCHKYLRPAENIVQQLQGLKILSVFYLKFRNIFLIKPMDTILDRSYILRQFKFCISK